MRRYSSRSSFRLCATWALGCMMALVFAGCDGQLTWEDPAQAAAECTGPECVSAPETGGMSSTGPEMLDPGRPTPDTCGDGQVQAPEVCDGDCPASCSDGDACTTDQLIGDASKCDAQCVFTDVASCSDGDGCCPAGCNQTNDSDCAAVCENGVVESGETCDGDCPASCDDGKACTQDRAQGSAASCDLQCANDPISACQGGDGCCPAGCDVTSDSDCDVDCTDYDAWPENWASLEADVIVEVNRVRAEGADCGVHGSFPPAGPVMMNRELQVAARCHSTDMTSENFFSHTGSDGSSFSQRARRAGYGGGPRGENIAAGNGTAAATVTQWVNSDGHCRNLMNASIDRMGIGYSYDRSVRYRHYWTMKTGKGGEGINP